LEISQSYINLTSTKGNVQFLGPPCISAKGYASASMSWLALKPSAFGEKHHNDRGAVQDHSRSSIHRKTVYDFLLMIHHTNLYFAQFSKYRELLIKLTGCIANQRPDGDTPRRMQRTL